MCGRYNIIPDVQVWLAILGPLRDVLNEIDWRPRYNITPSSWVPIIRGSSDGESLVIDKARWGFVPSWVKEDKPKLQPANARSDNVAKSGYFRDAFKHRHCLFIASGFYEWQTTQAGKQPYHITTKDGSPFLMAGIWSNWKGDDTAAILTTEPNDLMQAIHNRMPVMIDHTQTKDWILGDEPERFLKPSSDENMKAYRVSKAVNKPSNDSPDLLAPID